MIPLVKSHQKTYRTSPNHHFWDFGARGHSVQQHEEKFENHPEDLQLPISFDDAGFIRNVSQRQLSVPITDIHLAGYGCTSSCREYTPKLVWFWLSWSQNVLTIVEWNQDRIFAEGGELKVDGYQQGVDKFVTELSKENKKPIQKRRLQAQGNLLRWNKDNNFFRPHLRHQLYQSNNESGKTFLPFRRLLTTRATESRKE